MKALSVVSFIIFCFFTLTVAGYAQNATSTPVSIADSPGSREQDGLRGPVRRVRVEVVNIITGNGKPVESQRALREVSTYNAIGRKIDSVAYPVEGTTAPGKEEYKYDKQGNIIEMTLRGNDGSVLSKEKYTYEFDEFGNWKKMTTAVAIYENGAITYEPTELTYRTLTYYYGPPMPKETARSRILSRNAERSVETEPKLVVDPPSQPTEVVPMQPVKTPEKSDTPPTGSSEPNPPKENTKPPILSVSEEALRKAAIELPQPEYPSEARLAGIAGQVHVQLIIDEKGAVNTARATSGNPLLFDAATTAASKARFSMSALSDRPTGAYGTVTYDFTRQTEVVSNIVNPPPAMNEMRAEKNTRTGTNVSVALVPTAEPTRTLASPSTSSTEVVATFTKPLSFAAYFDRGMASLAAAKYEDAVESLTQAIELNSEDAVAHAKLGVAYSALAAHRLAIGAFKQAIKLNRAFVDPDSYYRLGSSYLALSDYTSAVGPLKQALYGVRARQLEGRANPTAGPSETEINHALGLAYYGAGSYRQALKAFETAVRLKPDFASAHYGLGLSYFQVGDKRSAENEEQILRKLKSPLADRLTGMLITTAGQRNKVF